MKRGVIAAAIASLLGAACGKSGAWLDLSLYTPTAEEQDPFEGVRQLRVQINAPGLPSPLPPQLFDVGAGVGRITGLPLSRFVSVIVEGLAGADAQPLARGYSPPVDLLAGTNLKIPVFFAKIDRFASAVSVSARTRADLQSTRSGHTAAVLKDGRVLIAGGAVLSATGGVESDPLARTEIHDPNRGESIQGASMSFPRAFHTATLLKDGRMLIVGGVSLISGALSPLATAEIFDPADGSFRTLGAIREERGRAGHSATLLPDGRVLITGGWGQAAGSGREALASAEVFDPTRGAFSAVGPMSAGRAAHTATLLLDGRVLIVGGRGAPGALATSELFSPVAESFTPGPALPNEGRAGHTAVRLGSGAVLIAGGCSGPEALSASASAASGSGCHTFAALSTVRARVDLYDPNSPPIGRFLAGLVPPLQVARADHTATLLPGEAKMLLVGGLRGDGSTVATAEVIEEQPGASFARRNALGELRASRTFHAATRLASGIVLFSGGASRTAAGASFSVLSSVELYVP